MAETFAVEHAIEKPFQGFPKIPRLKRDCIVTEKIDGTNASIFIGEDGEFLVGSRNRWITPQADNYGFAKWAYDNKQELLKLGPGHHFGEWWGKGIQRGYGIEDKRFSLFNTHRWEHNPDRPVCCGVVPVIYIGPFTDDAIDRCIFSLQASGSYAAPGFMEPEGIVVYHKASGQMFKRTLKNDEMPKGLVE
jgi:hypothetical protein